MPNPSAIVAGGPAAVIASVIWKLSDVTVNGCESLDPGCTEPVNVSVTSGDVGADARRAAGDVPELESLVEHRTAASRQTAAASRGNFTVLLEPDYVAEG